MVGIYLFLGWFPFWGTAVILYFLVINLLFIIRDWREKLPYNISVASQQGDTMLIGVILIGIVVIGRQSSLVPWMNEIRFQIGWALVSFLVGLIDSLAVIIKSKSMGTLADGYHNLFIIPLLVFFLGVTSPVIYLYGTKIELIVSVILLMIWIVTFVFDAKTGRLQQSAWLAKHGINLPLNRVR